MYSNKKLEGEPLPLRSKLRKEATWQRTWTQYNTTNKYNKILVISIRGSKDMQIQVCCIWNRYTWSLIVWIYNVALQSTLTSHAFAWVHIDKRSCCLGVIDTKQGFTIGQYLYIFVCVCTHTHLYICMYICTGILYMSSQLR